MSLETKEVPLEDIKENHPQLKDVPIESENQGNDRVGTMAKKTKSGTIFNYFKDQKVKEFYEQQKELIEKYEEDINLTKLELSKEDQEKEDKKKSREKCLEILEKFTLYLSFGCNIFLFIIKLTASIISLSISIIASTLDSFLDLFSGFILFIATQIRNRKSKMDFYNFPVGKSRVEPIGIIIFAAVMITASLQVIKEAVGEIIDYFSSPQSWNGESLLQQYIGIAVLSFTVLLKSFLYILCRLQKNSASLQALADDHRNDVVSNTFILIALAISKFVYRKYTFWLDPTGAICISFYIIINWVRQIFEYATKLVGKTTDITFLKRITKIAFDHHPKILHVERISAFYVGLGIFVEIDLVLDPETPLKESHDIGEQLQNKIEKLDEVERCFVHLDYEIGHKPEEEHKKIV